MNESDFFSNEWLETNGLGGYASSTVSGANTRIYHGLLVVPHGAGGERFVLVSRLDETVVLGEQGIELGTALFAGSVIHPKGYAYLSEFSKAPFPTWTYQLAPGISLKKTLISFYGQNTTCISYELSGAKALEITFRPFLALRSYHSTTKANVKLPPVKDVIFADQELKITPADPTLPEMFLSFPNGTFSPSSDWYFNYHYPIEEERGLPAEEDLFTCAVIKTSLSSETPLIITLSTQSLSQASAETLIQKESTRRKKICDIGLGDPFAETLALAADQFLIRRADGSPTLLAGYHWFTDWGRDAMISLPGCCLVTKRFEEAKTILLTYSHFLSHGIIPNRFPDKGDIPEYNAVDSSLWYIVACYQYYRYTNDKTFVQTIYPTLETIISSYTQGTLFSIKVDADGLVKCGDPTTNLTWMDARINGEVPVTPRNGKPVEINALWYNALCILSEYARILNRLEDSRAYTQRANAAKAAFQSFVLKDKEYLADRLTNVGPDDTIRPNQIFALSLPSPLVDVTKAKSILATVRNHLLTPHGLRSLSKYSPSYHSTYSGSPAQRDAVYHQGIVWGWLIGPYITAVCRFEPENLEEIRYLLTAAHTHLSECGLGTISELFDAEPPYLPRGCMAQAWSVAELLRAYVEDVKPLFSY